MWHSKGSPELYFCFCPEKHELLDPQRKPPSLSVPLNDKQVSLFRSDQDGKFGGASNCPYLFKIPNTKQNRQPLIMKAMLSKTEPQARDGRHNGVRGYLKRDN